MEGGSSPYLNVVGFKIMIERMMKVGFPLIEVIFKEECKLRECLRLPREKLFSQKAIYSLKKTRVSNLKMR